MMINRKTISLILLIVGFALNLSCVRHNDCGSGDFPYREVIDISPYQNPIKAYDMFYRFASLLADGRLLINRVYPAADTLIALNLKQICQADTICDADLYISSLDSIMIENWAIITPHKIAKITSSGKIIIEFGNSGADSTKLLNAIYGYIDSANSIYIIDSGDSYIKEYDRNGQFIMRFMEGTAPYRLSIYGDKIYVLDRVENRIQEYNSGGILTGRALSSDYLDEIVTFDLYDGIFWVADRGGTRISGLSLDGEVLESKSNLCFHDFLLDFGRVINISRFSRGFWITDYETNRLLAIYDKINDILPTF
jgi:hypothetical protein